MSNYNPVHIIFGEPREECVQMRLREPVEIKTTTQQIVDICRSIGSGLVTGTKYTAWGLKTLMRSVLFHSALDLLISLFMVFYLCQEFKGHYDDIEDVAHWYDYFEFAIAILLCTAGTFGVYGALKNNVRIMIHYLILFGSAFISEFVVIVVWMLTTKNWNTKDPATGHYGSGIWVYKEYNPAMSYKVLGCIVIIFGALQVNVAIRHIKAMQGPKFVEEEPLVEEEEEPTLLASSLATLKSFW